MKVAVADVLTHPPPRHTQRVPGTRSPAAPCGQGHGSWTWGRAPRYRIARRRFIDLLPAAIVRRERRFWHSNGPLLIDFGRLSLGISVARDVVRGADAVGAGEVLQAELGAVDA